jgi:hypothetical protein
MNAKKEVVESNANKNKFFLIKQTLRLLNADRIG